MRHWGTDRIPFVDHMIAGMVFAKLRPAQTSLICQALRQHLTEELILTGDTPHDVLWRVHHILDELIAQPECLHVQEVQE